MKKAVQGGEISNKRKRGNKGRETEKVSILKLGSERKNYNIGENYKSRLIHEHRETWRKEDGLHTSKNWN